MPNPPPPIQAVGKKSFSFYLLHWEIKQRSRNLCNTRARQTLCKLWRKFSVTAWILPSEGKGDAKPQKLPLKKSPGNTTLSDPLQTPILVPLAEGGGESSISSCTENICFQIHPKRPVGVPASSPQLCRWVTREHVYRDRSKIPGGCRRISFPPPGKTGVSGKGGPRLSGAGFKEVGMGWASAFGSFTTGRESRQDPAAAAEDVKFVLAAAPAGE